MRTGASLLKVAVAVAVAATVSSAMAQGGGGGRGRGGFQVNPITVAKVEGVQKDLELSGEQKDALGKLEVERVDFQAFQGDREGMQKKLTEIRDSSMKKVDEILAPPQRSRFAEILLQVDGVAALRQPKVAEKLKLTDEQKTKLAELFAPRQGGGGGGGGGGQQAREERDAKAMEILTADQKKEFVSMQGKKIEIDRSQLIGPGGGGQGRQRKGPDA
jgi:Spy/CpxP family protein refolding chaperone